MDKYNSLVLRGVVTTALVLHTCLPHVVGVKFDCHSDKCNRGNEEQFCSEYFKLCRNCADIVDDCGNTRQPINCTSYCTSHLVKMEQQKIQGSSCSMYRKPTNGFIVPLPKDGRFLIGTNISITCKESYTLIGPRTMTCLGNDTWTGDDTAFCLDNSYLRWQVAGTVLAVVVSLAILVAFLVIYCHVKHCMNKRIQQGQPAKGETDSLSESGIEVSITVEDETSPLMTEEQSHTQQKPTMEDKCVETESDERDFVPNNDTSPPSSSEHTETPAPSSSATNESNNRPTHQPLVNTVNVNVTLSQSQMISNEQQKDNATLTDEVIANRSKEGRKRSVAEKISTEESQITLEAIKETSGKGTEPLTPRIESDSSPNRGTPMKMNAVPADTIETINDDPKIVGLKERTFHTSDAQ